MRTDKSYMIVISHFKLYPALFPLKWLICIPNISAVRGNVVFETLHDFYRTAILLINRKLIVGKNVLYHLRVSLDSINNYTSKPFSSSINLPSSE